MLRVVVLTVGFAIGQIIMGWDTALFIGLVMGASAYALTEKVFPF